MNAVCAASPVGRRVGPPSPPHVLYQGQGN
jgi:hypothetical protein